jgi:hypothetical protein
MLWVILAVFAFGLSLGGLGMEKYHEGKDAIAAQQLAAAQKKIDDAAAATAAKEAADQEKIHQAYLAGEANTKTVYQTIVKKGTDYVATAPVFSNPDCVVDAAGLQLVNSARASVLAARTVLGLDTSVPIAGAAAGRETEHVLLTGPQGRPSLGGVHPTPSPVSAGGATQPNLLQKPAKPVPIR